ncbi:MAG: NAD(P)/FAD-dependent oxidoreductase [Betaproteobacteria bacterium]|nr:NAD(P)/FAD-dependent oxidoreductase [Betaproteobacteria bacterium]MDH5220918.1 NAD(P)/FAD-dependent oxidoreductase [Betaproteobacteria bacterium]MDH5350106.1 NAD(P)/FAD-dependent oxidoreductase [Betaproteobacteria bacterium]
MSDAIVIGSGIGGLACAAALAKCGRKVLVLEQHFLAGGLTQTFTREGYTWDVGLHYLGDLGPQGKALLDWLSDGGIEIAPTDAAFDTVHFPEGFEFSYVSPPAAARDALKKRFPGSAGEIDAFFTALEHAGRAAMAMFQARALPRPIAALVRWWKRDAFKRWVARTTEEVLREIVSDPRLRAVLSAQWPDHGGSPKRGSFAMHAAVMRHFLAGSGYPVGGAAVFAKALVPVIERAGGKVVLKARVERLLLERGRVAGVLLADGTEHRAAAVVSAAGARNTVEQLLPTEQRAAPWARDILSMELTPCHVGLYLGLAGDLRAAGATTANHWIYGSWDTNAATWRDPGRSDPPGMFVSFPSLKDPSHVPGPEQRHTAEVVAWVDWETFAPWQESSPGHRPPDYERYKAMLGERLLDYFKRCFPRLAPLVRLCEVSTPLTMVHYTRTPLGAVYSLAPTPARFLSKSLGTRTPLKGLYLAGQDAMSPGVTGAMMGGVMAAGALAPQVFRRLG